MRPGGPGNKKYGYAGSKLGIPSRETNREDDRSPLEFLTRTENQLQYQELTGSLPAGIEAWEDESLANDPVLSVFG